MGTILTIAAVAASMAVTVSAAKSFVQDDRFPHTQDVRTGDIVRAPDARDRSSHRRHGRIHRHPTRQGKQGRSRTATLSVAAIAPVLARKAAEIADECGSRVVSAIRHTRVAGTRRSSLHAFGKAVDMRGNPSCIYAHLQDWPGGYSTDYNRVKHVHISYDPHGREWGVRFAHGGGRLARRYARGVQHRLSSL